MTAHRHRCGRRRVLGAEPRPQRPGDRGAAAALPVRPGRRAGARRARRRTATVQATASLDDVLADPDVDAVAIATPGRHPPRRRAGRAGGRQARPGREAARRHLRGRREAGRGGRGPRPGADAATTPTATPRRCSALRALVRDGELGDIQYVDSVRINLGLVQPDIDVLWDLAPHDLSILDCDPARRRARRSRWPRTAPTRSAPATPASAYLTVQLSNGAIAHVHVNWLSPDQDPHDDRSAARERTVVWDDLNPTQRLAVYDRGVDRTDPRGDRRRGPRAGAVSYRIGDMVAPALPEREALRAVMAEFAAAITRAARPAAPTAGPACACSRAGGRRREPGERRRVRARLRGARRDALTQAAQPIAGQRVLVTGGAGTIGSHRRRPAGRRRRGEIVVLDNLVRGRRANLAAALSVAAIGRPRRG